jgi:hypothetical protein
MQFMQFRITNNRVHVTVHVHSETYTILGEVILTTVYYDRMTVHRTRFLVNKTTRCTEFQFYWYYYFTCFGQAFCPSSGVLRRKSALLHFMQLWWPFTIRSRMDLMLLLVSNGSSQLHKMYRCLCRTKNSWWWAERLPETCRVVIPIKLEFSASLGFIHKEYDYSIVFLIMYLLHSCIRMPPESKSKFSVIM